MDHGLELNAQIQAMKSNWCQPSGIEVPHIQGVLWCLLVHFRLVQLVQYGTEVGRLARTLFFQAPPLLEQLAVQAAVIMAAFLWQQLHVLYSNNGCGGARGRWC
jgi:hypothetical protein